MQFESNNLELSPRLRRRRRVVSHRRGMVLLAVLVLFTVSLTLFGVWSRAIVQEHTILATQQYRLQAISLAEAGLKPAVALRGTNSTYAEEVCSVPAAELDHLHAAQVRIHVAPAANSN